jgi:hypothetical protein
MDFLVADIKLCGSLTRGPPMFLGTLKGLLTYITKITKNRFQRLGPKKEASVLRHGLCYQKARGP